MGVNSWCSMRCSHAQGSAGWILMNECAGLTRGSYRLKCGFHK